MVTLSTISKPRRTGGTRRNTLGIDIGTSGIKLAKMVWEDECWTVANRLTLPIPTQPRDFPQEVFDGLLGKHLQPLQNRPLAQKHECACVLPMSLTDLRSVEVPQGSDSDVEKMALESLKDLYPDDFDERITRLWQQNETGHDLAHVSSLSLADILAVRIVEQLATARLNCGAIDGLPFALARAADMSPADCSGQPIALLDGGHTSVTFVISRRGRPEFVRTFRDCGGHRSVTAIAQGMNLDDSDARNVLATFGFPGDGQTTAVRESVNSLTDSDSSQTLQLPGIISSAAQKNNGRISVQRLNVTSFDRPIVTADSRVENETEKRSSKDNAVLEQRMQLDLNGIAVNDLAVASFVAFLRESGVFESVELKSSISQVCNHHETRGYEVSCVY